MTSPGTAVFYTSTGAHPISVQIARQPSDRGKGLLGVTGLPERTGMIFEFDPPVRTSISTRGMAIPLDIVFISAAGFVLSTVSAPANSGTYDAGHLVRWVAELPVGTVYGLRILAGSQFLLVG